MVKTITMVFLGMGLFIQSQAQDSTKKAADTTAPAPVSPAGTITGSLDVYYRFNFANPKSGNTNNLTSFTNSQNSFELGEASIRADHSFGKASVTVDLGFGRRAQEFSYNDGEANGFFSLASVKQAFVSYTVSNHLKLTMGKWGTHIGYEVLDAYLNRNYSMSYMFSYGPFSHTGLKADIAIAGKTAIMVGIANPSDYATTTSSRKWIIAQLSTATPDNNWKFFLNYQGGKYDFGSSLNHFDLVVNGTITSKFSVGYNGTLQTRKPDGGSSGKWWGSAIYINVDPVPVFGLTLRGEYFSDKDGILFPSLVDEDTGKGADFMEYTLSGNIRIGKLTIIPEIRLDNSNTEVFEKHDGGSNKSTVSAILAATYSF